MKAILISPAELAGVPLLFENTPLCNIQVCGKSIIAYWLEHLARLGAKEVLVLATDRPEQVRRSIGEGSRWGLKVEVLPELRELTPEEARTKYRREGETWLADGMDAVVMDELPGVPEKLFDSYSSFVNVAHRWMPHAAATPRIGLREIEPGVWVGLHSRIAPSAVLHSPCWIGDNVSIGSDAVIGPMAIIEDRNMVEAGAEVAGSYVAPDTFIGVLTRVRNSIAAGDLLIDWRNESSLRVPDAFLMCSLRDHRPVWHEARWLSRFAAVLAFALTLPLAIFPIVLAWLQGQRPFRPRRAVLPQTSTGTVVYYEMAAGSELWRRWPQLWNVMRGEFSWVGNRPLHPFEAGKLINDFERLWLSTPIGIISQADAEGCSERFSDETRAHASFYSVQVCWRLKFSVLGRGFMRLLAGVLRRRSSESLDARAKPVPFRGSLAR